MLRVGESMIMMGERGAKVYRPTKEQVLLDECRQAIRDHVEHPEDWSGQCCGGLLKKLEAELSERFEALPEHTRVPE